MRTRFVAAALTCALLTGGCAVVPTAGPVNPAPGLPANAGDPVVGVIVRPPHSGMTPVAVVQGYLDAMAQPTGDYAIARSYLTPSRAAMWQPNLFTTVYDGPGQLEQDGSHIVRLNAARVGTIDHYLRWSASGPSSQLAVTFGLTQINHEWRIDSAPNGLLLTGGDVTRGYRGFPIYFGAPSGKVLVADGALVPVESSNTATLLTRLLLHGPASWLTTAVTTGFPRGTALTSGVVPIVNGVAEVDLTSEALNATSRERTMLAAQLTSTLSAVPDVYSVAITISGVPLALPNHRVVLPIDFWHALLPESQSPSVATFVSRRGPALLDLGRVTPLAGAIRAGIATNPVLNLPRTQVAGLTRQHVAVLARADGSVSRTLPGSSNVSALTIDRNGLVWAVRSGALLAWNAQGQPIPVFTPNGVRVDRFSIAPDGVRIALSRLVSGASQLVVGAITRRSDGLHIGGLHGVSRNAVSPADVAWSDDTSVVVLVTAPTSSIFDVNSLTGQNAAVVAVQQAVDVAASAQGSILVGTTNGLIWQTSPAFAQEVARGSQPAFGG